jgi:hypothetical protein
MDYCQKHPKVKIQPLQNLHVRGFIRILALYLLFDTHYGYT